MNDSIIISFKRIQNFLYCSFLKLFFNYFYLEIMIYYNVCLEIEIFSVVLVFILLMEFWKFKKYQIEMVKVIYWFFINEIKTCLGELLEGSMFDLKGRLIIDQNLYSRYLLFKIQVLYSIIVYGFFFLSIRIIWFLNLISDILIINEEKFFRFLFRQIKRIQDFLLFFGFLKFFNFF